MRLKYKYAKGRKARIKKRIIASVLLRKSVHHIGLTLSDVFDRVG